MCGCTLSLLLRLSYCGELSLSLPYSNFIMSALNLLFLNELATNALQSCLIGRIVSICSDLYRFSTRWWATRASSSLTGSFVQMQSLSATWVFVWLARMMSLSNTLLHLSWYSMHLTFTNFNCLHLVFCLFVYEEVNFVLCSILN